MHIISLGRLGNSLTREYEAGMGLLLMLLLQMTYRPVKQDTQPSAAVDPFGSALLGQLGNTEYGTAFYTLLGL